MAHKSCKKIPLPEVASPQDKKQPSSSAYHEEWTQGLDICGSGCLNL